MHCWPVAAHVFHGLPVSGDRVVSGSNAPALRRRVKCADGPSTVAPGTCRISTRGSPQRTHQNFGFGNSIRCGVRSNRTLCTSTSSSTQRHNVISCASSDRFACKKIYIIYTHRIDKLLGSHSVSHCQPVIFRIPTCRPGGRRGK